MQEFSDCNLPVAADRLHTWLLKQVPEPNADVPRFLAIAAMWGEGSVELACSLLDHRESHLHFDWLLASIDRKSIEIIDLSRPFFEAGNMAALQADGRPLYYDSTHLSANGAVFAARSLESLIAAIAQTGNTAP